MYWNLFFIFFFLLFSLDCFTPFSVLFCFQRFLLLPARCFNVNVIVHYDVEKKLYKNNNSNNNKYVFTYKKKAGWLWILYSYHTHTCTHTTPFSVLLSYTCIALAMYTSTYIQQRILRECFFFFFLQEDVEILGKF